VPVVGAGVALFSSETHGRLKFPEDESALSRLVKNERVSPTQSQAVVGRVEVLFHTRFWVETTDAFHEPLSFRRGDAALRETDTVDLEVGRTDGFVAARQRRYALREQV
jgi:hypothetical protein